MTDLHCAPTLINEAELSISGAKIDDFCLFPVNMTNAQKVKRRLMCIAGEESMNSKE